MSDGNRGFLLTLALAGCVAASPARADFERTVRLSADTVELHNLVGQVEIEGHDGPDFEVRVRVGGGDATPDRVRVDTDEGRRAEIRIRFPLDESRRYVYPRLQGGSTSFTLDDGDGGWLAWLFGRNNVKVAGSGRGLELWADATVRVPRGGRLLVTHGAGAIAARQVDADLELSIHSGPIEVSAATGSVALDTGSGHVTASGVRGRLHADTGSGHVSLTDITGDGVHVDTGSGHVELAGIVARDLHVDTGSGRVEIDGADGSSLVVDTGSGRIEARAVAADEMTIDTGSGSVTLELDRMGGGRFEIDTGSGAIDLRLPPDASAEFDCDTGGGGIDLDLASGHRVLRLDDHEAAFVVGDGRARVVLDTGSGGIRVRQ